MNEKRIIELERELRQLRTKRYEEQQKVIQEELNKIKKLDWIDGHKILLESNYDRKVVLNFIYMKEEHLGITRLIGSDTKLFREEGKEIKIKRDEFSVSFDNYEKAIKFIKDNRLEVQICQHDYGYAKVLKELNTIRVYESEEHQEWKENN
jgi:hypothetical protein